MRADWVPVCASALVVGALALVLGVLLNPAPVGASSAETLRSVTGDGGRWLAMAVMYFVASSAMLLGLPAVLSLLVRVTPRFGVVAIVVFGLGLVATSGYAVLLVFFRALVQLHALRTGAIDQVVYDPGIAVFLYGWIATFYGGAVLLAIALFRVRELNRWVPVALLVFVVMLPLSSHAGRVGQALQTLALALAFTGIAVAAVSDQQRHELGRTPVG